MPWVTLLLGAVLPLHLVARRAAGERNGAWVVVTGVLTLVVAAAAVVLVALTGDAGARAVWG